MKRRKLIEFTVKGLMLAGLSVAGSRVVSSQTKTGIILDDSFLKHEIRAGHPESPARYRAIRDKILNAPFYDQLTQLSAMTDIEKWLLTVHSQAHIDTIKKTDLSTHELVSQATGSALAAVKAVCEGQINNAFCPTRPPGHHALNTGREEGFCFYNHIAIAARYAQKAYGLKKIAIIDWDYHHGNGTEAAFYDDPDVLFISTHDLMAYPGTGFPSRRGEGAGKGLNINIDLGCGAGDEEYLDVYRTIISPAIDAFKPELILISCGFDSRNEDLLGCHKVTDAGYEKLTRRVMAMADKHCQGRLISVLEGGYNVQGSADASLVHLKSLRNL